MQNTPKYKLCRRLGSGVFEKCQTQKYVLREDRRASTRLRGRRPKALSDYGRQLIEKQKIRLIYGLSESQLSSYVQEAVNKKDVFPAQYLLELIERRLDSVVSRMSLAPTRRAARQMVTHGHILVNGRRVTVPSHRVRVNDAISVREASKKSFLFANALDHFRETVLPSWVSFQPRKMEGRVNRAPTSEDLQLDIDASLVLEFYSR
jgi:small subunit ribosomal protein S4